MIGEIIRKTTPDVTVEVFPGGMQRHVAREFVSGCDLIIDCIDFCNVDDRYDLHREFRGEERCKGCLASSDSIVLALDMHTTRKAEFVAEFVSTILEPRNLVYRIRFPGPTGTNANEAALALARKATGRSSVFAFTN